MPDHHLHPYFRFLVDHQELLSASFRNKEVKNITVEQNGIGAMGNGALSLLSSLYGTGEDDEGAHESEKNDEQKAPGVTDTPQEVSQEPAQTGILPVVPVEKDSSKDLGFKEKLLSKRSLNQGTGMVCNFESVKKAIVTSSKQFAVAAMENRPAPDVLEMPKPEAIILEPPSDTKKLIDKIVEFVQRNGKEVETVLREQDVKHGRFPFLVSTNLYHPYYLKRLQSTQGSSATEKSAPEKDSARRGMKTAGSKESESVSVESAEFPFDANKKEKFTMVLGKSKEPVLNSKASEAPVEVGMDTATIAAILQAATRGAKLPSSMILSKSSVNGSSQNMDGHANSNEKQDLHRLRSASVPLAKNIAKTAALAAASEADSSEASLSKEQKLKAERLKRAKMFAAMIKGGGASIKTALGQGNSEERFESGASGLNRGSSVDRPESGASEFVGEVELQAVKEREGSSIPPDVGISEEIEKFEMKVYDDENKERISKRSYRSNSNKNVGIDNEVPAYRKSSHKHRSRESDEESTEVEGHSRKKHRSRRHGNEDDVGADENDGKGHSRKKHRSHRYDDENDDGGKVHSRKKHKSHRSSNHSKERHEHDKEHSSKHHSHRHRHHSSDDDDELDHHRSGTTSRKERQSHTDSASLKPRESSPEKTTTAVAVTASDIPDELRAKVRAMLLASL